MKTTTTILSLLLCYSTFARERPSAGSSIEQTKSQCASWARESKRSGVSALIVSYEGLVSYSESAAKKTYNYFDQVRSGTRVKAPSIGSMNFVAKNVIIPHMGEIARTSEILLLSENSEREDTSVGATCVKEWQKVYGDSLRLSVLGHSFGGYAALRLAKAIKGSVIVDQMLTMDARAMPGEYQYFQTPSNVREHYNYFHKGAVMPGYAIEGADLNERVHTNHVGVTTDDKVQARFESLL